MYKYHNTLNVMSIISKFCNVTIFVIAKMLTLSTENMPICLQSNIMQKSLYHLHGY
jgi:hypothetical protein